MKKEIFMFAPCTAVRQPKRFAKMIPQLISAGYTIRFFGWERRRGECDELRWADSNVREEVILRGGGYVSRTARAMYPLWMLAVFLKVIRLRKSGALLFCLGWETAFPARLACAFTSKRVIFDDGDRFSMILRLPAPLHSLLQALERWTSRNCFRHLVPGWTRYGWRNSNMRLLRNMPSKSDLSAAIYGASTKSKNANLVLYANGWLGATRGAAIFLEALNRLSGSDLKIEMIIAGRVDSTEGVALIRHQSVTYYGEVSQLEALALYPAADVVLTYYDPCVPINRHAESNKWGDCIFFGTPFIVNSEVETASEFVSSGAAWAVEYHAVDDLVSLLERLATKKQLVEEASRKMMMFREKYPLFEVQLDRIIDELSI